MPDTLIIGGGLCGLVSAYHLHQAGHAVHVVEAGPRFGGVMQSVQHEGYTLELGPNTFPGTGEHIMALCHDLGLNPVASREIARRRYVARNGRLHALPASPWQAVSTPLLSPVAKLRLLLEPFQPVTHGQDTTLSEFIRRRLGPEVLDYLAGPFVSGVYAGNPDAMSMQAVFPKLLVMEQSHGSLLKAILARKKSQKKSKNKQTGRLFSFENGMTDLIAALEAALPTASKSTHTRVIRLQKAHDGYLAELENGDRLQAGSLILATPAATTATLLEDIQSMDVLSDIPYAPMAVIHLGVSADQILPHHPLDGFGMLIPDHEDHPVLGCLWNSSLFARRAPEDHVLLTCFVGGARHPELFSQPDDALIHQTCQSLSSLLGAPNITPAMTHVTRWPKAIPQFIPGHPHRISAVEAALAKHPAIRITGNFISGVSVNDCVRHAALTAGRIQTHLQNCSGLAATQRIY